MPDVDITRLCPVTKPTQSQPCNVDPCKTFWWKKSVGPCSKTCGGGSQSVTGTCVDAAGNPAADDNQCPGEKPSGTAQCNVNACDAYVWFDHGQGVYGPCTRDCGSTGFQSKDYRCKNTATKEYVDESVCEQDYGMARPADYTITCNRDVDICSTKGSCNDDKGKCLCDPGYKGAYCEQAPSITNVVADSGAGGAAVSADAQIPVTWDSSGTFPSVEIGLGRASEPFQRYARANAPNTGYFTWTVPPGLAGGSDLVHLQHPSSSGQHPSQCGGRRQRPNPPRPQVHPVPPLYCQGAAATRLRCREGREGGNSTCVL